MKYGILFFMVMLLNAPANAQEKRRCTVFWANFIGLEAALDACLPTPEFLAWVKEERERIAREEREKKIGEWSWPQRYR